MHGQRRLLLWVEYVREASAHGKAQVCERAPKVLGLVIRRASFPGRGEGWKEKQANHLSQHEERFRKGTYMTAERR